LLFSVDVVEDDFDESNELSLALKEPNIDFGLLEILLGCIFERSVPLGDIDAETSCTK
jgi:hypothetical protein